MAAKAKSKVVRAAPVALAERWTTAKRERFVAALIETASVAGAARLVGVPELISSAGVRSVSVSGAGVFTGSTAETRLKTNALAGVIDDIELSFESGERMQGKFLVSRLDHAGDFNGERSYTLSLESSGPVVTL